MQRWSKPRIVGMVACVVLLVAGFMPAHTFIYNDVDEESLFEYTYGISGIVAVLSLGLFYLNRRWADVTALVLTVFFAVANGVEVFIPNQRLAPWNLHHYGLDVAEAAAIVAAIMAAVCIAQRRRSPATSGTER